MNKLLTALIVITLALGINAQEKAKSAEGSAENDRIDFIILEMKLGAILGGYKNGKFVDARTAAKGVKISESYTVFGLGISKKDSVLKLTKSFEVMEDVCPEYVAIATDRDISSGVALSSNARWNAVPRIPKPIDPNSKIYRSIVAEFLRSKEIKYPTVGIKKIFLIDLEGDGTDEVVIHAENRAEKSRFDTKAGDYSFILLRKIVNGKVKNFFLTGEVITKKIEDTIPYNFELSAIADLDGDGEMEIITYGSYYEGAWSEVFKIEGGKVSKILETGCGV